MMGAKKNQASTVDEFVKELKKTKGDVTVTTDEVTGETVVRTRDGDTHRFDEAWQPLEKEA